MRIVRSPLVPLLALALLGAFVRPSAAEDAPPPAPAPGMDDDPAPDDGAEESGEEQAEEKVPFVEEVNEALDKGVKWLLGKPKFLALPKVQAAHWGLISSPTLYGGGTGPGYGHPAGATALALYTLLKCGVPPDHPTIVEGFHWLRVPHTITKDYDGNGDLKGSWSHADKMVPSSYELSAMVLALCAKYDRFKKGKNTLAAARAGKLRIKDPADLEWLQTMVTSLVSRRGIPGASAGAKAAKADTPKDRLGWRYNIPEVTVNKTRRTSNRPPHANQDLSSTQLATLALFSARRFGVQVPPQVWFDVIEYTLGNQEKEGPEHDRFDPSLKDERYAAQRKKDRARGFCYIPGSPDGSEGVATGSMTACGIANLLMAREVLTNHAASKDDWVKRGYDKKVETAIWDGLAWLDFNWSSFRNTNSRYGYHIYYLYSLERAMDLLGKNLVGEHLWYSDCAREILSNKKTAKSKVRLEKNAEVESFYWETGDTHDPKDVLDTCFALLFLKRATRDMMPPPPIVTPAAD